MTFSDDFLSSRAHVQHITVTPALPDSSRAANRAGVEQPSIILELLNSKDVLEVEPIEPPQLEQKSQNDFEEQQHSQSNQASKELKVY